MQKCQHIWSTKNNFTLSILVQSYGSWVVALQGLIVIKYGLGHINLAKLNPHIAMDVEWSTTYDAWHSYQVLKDYKKHSRRRSSLILTGRKADGQRLLLCPFSYVWSLA